MDTPLNDKEKKQLDAALGGGAPESPFLFTTIIQAMKQTALIATPSPLLNRSFTGILIAISMALILLMSGYLIGAAGKAAPQGPKEGNALYALLVKSDDVPADDAEQQFREYTEWVNQLKKERWADGEALHGSGTRLKRNEQNEIMLQEHGFRSSADELSGYFLFEAKDMAEAIKIAESCPHLNYKGTLELRQVFRN